MRKVAILSFSDSREFLHHELDPLVVGVEERIAAACEGFGAEVVRGREPVSSAPVAVQEARRLAAQRPDLTIFNYPVWAFPHFSAHAARATVGPLLLYSNIDTKYPGMVGLLGAGGSLDQIGRQNERLWGEVEEEAVGSRLRQIVAAAHATRSLEGCTFGRFGGRVAGMYTAVSHADEWMARFGIDVEEVDQWEIARRSDLVPAGQGSAGRQWLETHAAGVEYDGKQVTPEILEGQVRTYLRDERDHRGTPYRLLRDQGPFGIERPPRYR